MSRALIRVTRLLQASCITSCHQLKPLQCPNIGVLATRDFCTIPASSILATKASHRLQSFTGSSAPSIRHSSTSRIMSNGAAPTDPAIDEILKFWFEEIPHSAWFQPSPELNLDAIITDRFLSHVEKAVNTDALDHWTSTSKGTLALILCLDQFTRNIYRPGGHPQPGLSWSGDAKALKVASEAIAKDFDRDVEAQYRGSNTWGAGREYRMFYYLPFMHAEDLVAQIACVAMLEGLSQEVVAEGEAAGKKGEGKQKQEGEPSFADSLKMAVPFAKKHRDCVATLGKFPKRNEPLGREHTEADKAWLEKFPNGF